MLGPSEVVWTNEKPCQPPLSVSSLATTPPLVDDRPSRGETSRTGLSSVVTFLGAILIVGVSGGMGRTRNKQLGPGRGWTGLALQLVSPTCGLPTAEARAGRRSQPGRAINLRDLKSSKSHTYDTHQPSPPTTHTLAISKDGTYPPLAHSLEPVSKLGTVIDPAPAARPVKPQTGAITSR